jgi:hypothetical protein
MLGLSVLLLAVAGVVFVGVITDLEPWSQLVILLAVVVIALATAPPVARRGLTATAETVAVVGLLVVSIAGYALWTTEVVRGLPGPTFGGLVAACTAAVGYGYHLLTHLNLPRWTALAALQPALPLLAYPLITGPAGWALVFALVAAHNAGIAAVRGPRLMRYAAWVLHAAAVAAAIGYASAGLIVAETAAGALPAGLTLVLAAAVGVGGALGLRHDPIPDVAGGLFAFAVMVSAGRVLALALPGRALLPVTAVVAITALAVRLLPRRARKGPLWAVIVASAGIGLVVTALSLRAGVAALVVPPWPEEGLTDHRTELADAAALTAGWQLAPTAAALTIATALIMPKVARRESTVAGVALTALAAPASFGLEPVPAAWVLLVATVGLLVAGLAAQTHRAVTVHVAAASVTGLAAAGAALSTPALTATILVTLTVATAIIARSLPRHPEAALVTEWAAGAATLALPGAAATAAVAFGFSTPAALVSAFAALCASLGYAAATQLRHRFVPVPVLVGASAATVVVAAFAFTLGQVSAVDRAIAALLVATALLIYAAPRMDAFQPSYRLLDGADLAAAALTASAIATLARLALLVLPISGPDSLLATAATIVFLVTLGIRAVPRELRRGPVLGVSVFGGLAAAIAGAAAMVSGVQVLAAPGPLWDADIARWWPPATALADLTWATPFALTLFAVAAALVIPRPTGSRVSAGLAVLATVAAPVALGMGWRAPATLAVAVGAVYALSAVVPVPWRDPAAEAPASARPTPLAPGTRLSPVPPAWERAATARAAAGGALGLYAVGAALARPWTTAAVLGVIMLVATVVAALAARLPRADPRRRVGGTAVAGALLATPAALAAVSAQLGQAAGMMLLAALAGSTLGLAALAALPTRVASERSSAETSLRLASVAEGSDAAGIAARYLPYGTVGVTAGATAVAFFALPTTQPAGVYAAAAALLAVLAELLRAARRPPGHRSLVRPAVGAMIAAAAPAMLALATLAPALVTALVEPYRSLAAPWQGPPATLLAPDPVGPSSVIAALLLTLAAALAAVGFGGAVTRQAVPVVAPGLAITLLIAPDALGAPWPAGTVAALLVFTISVLGVALTPPPPVDLSTRPLRVNRQLVLGIGLAAGGAGLAGALADPQLSWGTFGGAIAVGAAAALEGKTRMARLLGWLGAALAAQLFALTTAYLLGAAGTEFAFALLAVGAVALLAVTRLRALRPPAAAPELMAVEGLGGYASLVAAFVVALGSPPDLAAVLIGTGAVLGLAALRPGRPHRWRRGLWWSAAICEVAAWWIIMGLLEVPVLEAYTLPFAFFALVVGALEVRYRPELGSWVTWGPGLISAFAPSLVVVITTTEPEPYRQAWVLVGGVATLILGSRLRQRAPVIIGTVVATAAALHLLSLAGPWLVLVPLGILLLILGANREKRQRDLERLRGAYSRMR